MVNSRSSGRNLMKHLHRSALGTLAAMSLIWTLVPAATADQHSGKPTDGDGIVGIAAPEFPDPNSEPSVTPEPSIEPTADAPIDPRRRPPPPCSMAGTRMAVAGTTMSRARGRPDGLRSTAPGTTSALTAPCNPTSGSPRAGSGSTSALMARCPLDGLKSETSGTSLMPTASCSPIPGSTPAGGGSTWATRAHAHQRVAAPRRLLVLPGR